MEIKIEISIDNQEIVELLEEIINLLEDVAYDYAREESQETSDGAT